MIVKLAVNIIYLYKYINNHFRNYTARGIEGIAFIDPLDFSKIYMKVDYVKGK